ncbi:sensor histidine kinase [Paraburkholderia fungorum]|uniref:histidine kinase n=1 Tax=Paraburkholderia fungorum TaxID=134537 RepID=A0AAW3URR1_9BURK|nr:sensor histidine kinase [Paraburkholderia fungorum]MBB4513627.1 signal transduction histidine kinase [Paraburkholderia fungorum]MBB6200868.1 signal transduction histidine kinase [Paraburkholderia fungorum]MBU7439726.1 sensor histidine kinase [Paraburkholderia fungorum]
MSTYNISITDRPASTHLAESELFLSAPIPILIEDWSRVYRAIRRLQSTGISDIDKYFDAHPEAVADLRALHSFVAANDAVVSLFEAGSMERFMDRAKMLLPADRTSNGAVLRAMFENRSTCQGERTLVTFTGRTVPIVWRCSLPKNEEGYRRLCFYAFDVTEQKENSDRLEALRTEMARASRVSLFGEVSASILHEISQPLSAARASADASLRWLTRERPDVQEAAVAIRDAARWARDATEICRRIRGFVGKVPVQMVSFPASESVNAAILLIKPEANAKDIHVDSSVDADAHVFADPIQIQQVLANLLLNGIQAIATGHSAAHTLTVKVRRDGNEVVFEVRDTGPGVDPAMIEQLFQPFYTSKPDGMGMGLPVARSIVEAHNGRIWAHGAPGEGTCFGFTLPATSKP